MALVCLPVVCAFLLGGVHDPVRMGVVMVVVGTVLWSGRPWFGPVPSSTRPPKVVLWTSAILAGALVVDCLHLIPVSWEATTPISRVVRTSLDYQGLRRFPRALSPRDHLLSMAFFAAGALAMGTIAQTMWSTSRLRRSMVALTAGSVAVALLGLVQSAFGTTGILGTSYGTGPGAEFWATFVNNNHAAAFIGASAPLALSLFLAAKRRPLLYLGAFVTLMAGVTATGSRGGLSASIVGVGCVLVLWGPAFLRYGLLLGVTSAGLAACYLGPRQVFSWYTSLLQPDRWDHAELSSGRVDLYRDALNLPMGFLGFGGGGFEDALHTTAHPNVLVTISQAHMDYIQLVLEHGSVVAGLAGLAVIVSFSPAVQHFAALPDSLRTQLAGVLGTCVSLAFFGLFDFPMRIGALFMLGCVCWGLLLGGLTRNLPTTDNRWLGRIPSACLLGVAVVCMLGLVVSRPPFADASRLTALGDESLDDFELDTARRAYKDALASRPLHHPTLFRSARLAALEGETDDARALLGIATRAWPSQPFPWLVLARFERQSGHLDAAADAYRALLRVPHSRDVRIEWAGEALTLFPDPTIAAMAVLPNEEYAWCDAAIAAIKMDQPETAEVLFQEALRLGERCRFEYAQFLVNVGRADDAEGVASHLEGCARDRIAGQVAFRRSEWALAEGKLQ